MLVDHRLLHRANCHGKEDTTAFGDFRKGLFILETQQCLIETRRGLKHTTPTAPQDTSRRCA